MNNQNLAIIPCPDLATYPVQPKDMSKCKAVVCSHCGKEMWLSEKKEVLMKFAKDSRKNVLIACYPCLTDMVKNNHDLISNISRIDI
jgi:hypothetical protein